MKNLAGILALLLLSSSAEAAVKMTYSGSLVSFLEGDFSGQLVLDPFTPDYYHYSPGETGASGDLVLSYGGSSFASSQLINSQAFNFLNTPLRVYIEDNVVINQTDIDDHGYTGIVSPGTYDFFSFELAHQDNRYGDGGLIDGSRLSLTGMFDSNAFSDNDLATGNLQQLMNLPAPLHFLFEAERRLGDSQDFRAAGLVTQFKTTEVSAVPLPGASWLFASVLAGFGLRQRRKN